MPILFHYWIKEFLRFFMIVQTIVIVIFICVDYVTNIERFFKSGISLFSGFEYVLLKTPFMLVQLTPAGTILAVAAVFGLMNKNNELLAIKSSGINILYIVIPALMIGVVLTVFMFFCNETIVPLTMSKANHIKYSVIKKKRNIYAVKENIWIKGSRNISHFKYFNPEDKTISGITITFLDKDFKIFKRVDADKGVFIVNSDINKQIENTKTSKNVKWMLFRVLEQQFDKSIQDFVITEHEQKEFDLELEPDDLNAVVKKSDEMDFSELSYYIKKVQSEGYDATIYKVDFWGKTAFPFICVIMSIIGAASGMRNFVKENLAFGIAVGLAASFFYWIVYGFSISLGYARILPPFISAWAANFLFLCAAVIYLLNTE